MFAFVFDSVGGGEWLVLLAVILIVVGPKNLPSAARKMGQVMSQLRRAADEFKRQLMTMDDEMKRTAEDLKREYIDMPEDSTSADRALAESAEAESSGEVAAEPDYSDDYPGQDYYGETDEDGLEVASAGPGADRGDAAPSAEVAATQSGEGQEDANGQDSETA